MGAAAAPAPFATVAALCCCSHRTTASTPLFVSSAANQRCGLRLRSTSERVSTAAFSSWSGLNRFSTSSWRKYTVKDKRGKCRGKAVYASLFGVGAPEALVIGVVALLVFGPKGLAEVARNLGKTLRAFQPTIRELQEVSREFKTTLEKEIGLDDIGSTNYINKSALYSDEKQQSAVDPNGKPSAGPYNSEELLKVTETQLADSSAARSQAESSNPVELPQAASTSTSEVSNPTPSNETGSQARVDTEVPSSGKTEIQR